MTRIPLASPAPGTQRYLTVRHYGEPDARPKAYVHASIHADELPGMLVAHHLARLLDEAAGEERIRGEIVLVPVANPIGLSQRINGRLLGRYELDGGGNFNRNWPDLAEPLAERVGSHLDLDAEENVRRIRAAIREILQDQSADGELAGLRLVLARLACDADIVLDLHCDSDALMHLYMIPQLWPEGADLSAEIASRATMLSEPLGGDPFDEAWSAPWAALRAGFPDKPVPMACFSATIEYRGHADVEDHLAAHDAGALFRFLQRRGVIEGDPPPLPEAQCDATPFSGVDVIRAPVAGIIAYKRRLGERVTAGDVIAELIDPMADHPADARRAILTRTDGLLFTRRRIRFARAGEGIAKIAGVAPLEHRKGRLLDD
ncbi:MAG TPA: succinylglutamate desuccinylase/aspartoacylase family protein [Alphaproteobacteria bacterium]|nr:succinylglutamate desuccinylase/aspartoacylase family protein [Alphaproteobacteria bacterium]